MTQMARVETRDLSSANERDGQEGIAHALGAQRAVRGRGDSRPTHRRARAIRRHVDGKAHGELLAGVGGVGAHDVAHQTVPHDVGLVEVVKRDAVDAG